ncbi:MAG: N-acetylmuramoyl-L-alanine amidase [Candidatus Firestonebacteria bacterium]
MKASLMILVLIFYCAFGNTAFVYPINVIVLDAGHGGDDIGVIGINGTKEKDVTLKFALAIKKNFENMPETKLILTRDSDINLNSRDRIVMANMNSGNIFVSLHANASFSKLYSGCEIYHNAFVLSGNETEGNTGSKNLPGGFVFWKSAQNKFVDDSAVFAKKILDELNSEFAVQGETGIVKNIRDIPLAVLQGLKMTAVVIEIGYIDNSVDEAKLADENFINKFASAITRAVSH